MPGQGNGAGRRRDKRRALLGQPGAAAVCLLPERLGKGRIRGEQPATRLMEVMEEMGVKKRAGAAPARGLRSVLWLDVAGGDRHGGDQGQKAEVRGQL